jgi:hypothetical protein
MDNVSLTSLYQKLNYNYSKKIDAFELWTWRKILGIPWTERRTNLSVLEQVKPKRSLQAT